MKALILDLRGNPGGYLDAATNIADELLDGDRPIVFTQGLHSDKVSYNTDKDGLFEKGPLAILVDENSASASEILAGAVQDYDRGLIIGRRTYGKGLVQEQYDLDDGSALRLTIAHYYTPSGRSIQRPYKQGREAYNEAFAERYKTGELTGHDSVVKEDTTAYYTSHRRIVRGGGGIKPDVYVPYDSSRVSPGLMSLLLSDKLQNTIFDYYTTHIRELKQYRTLPEFMQSFKSEAQLVGLFLQQLSPSERTIASATLARPAARSFLILQMKAQVARILFQNNGYYAVNATSDDVVLRALKLLHSSDQYLKIISR
jgi:carboxyl-terminal processing protease